MKKPERFTHTSAGMVKNSTGAWLRVDDLHFGPGGVMDTHYWNTTHSEGETLDLFDRKAKDQETQIAAFFARNRQRDFTPSEVWAQLYDGTIPLTSVRRAISNLTARGVLFKTGRQRPGPYKRPEHAWAVPNSPTRLAA